MTLAFLVACRGRIHPTDEQPEEPQWSAIEGTLEIGYTVGGFPVCDATVTFTGTPYAGECTDCDFAFAIDPVLARNEGNVGCPFTPWLTLYSTGVPWVEPTVLAFQDHNNGFADELLIGGTVSWKGETYTAFYDFADGDYGTTSFLGDQLAWALGSGGPDYFGYRYNAYGPFCTVDAIDAYTDRGPYPATVSIDGTLPCDSDHVDVFELQGEAGGTAYLTVDTTTEDPALDPAMWVYGPHSCIEQRADENFECSLGGRECPALRLDVEDAKYVVVVTHFGCFGDKGNAGGYRLGLDAAWEPELTQVEDDLLNYDKSELALTGTATLTK